MLDPMSYLTWHLQERFAPLANETMLQAVAEMMSFHRNQGENIDSLITRFNVIKHKAAQHDPS